MSLFRVTAALVVLIALLQGFPAQANDLTDYLGKWTDADEKDPKLVRKYLDAGQRLAKGDYHLVFATPLDEPDPAKKDRNSLFRHMIELHGGPGILTQSEYESTPSVPLIFASLKTDEKHYVGRTDVLLGMGVDPNIKNGHGRRLLDVALSNDEEWGSTDHENSALAVIAAGAKLTFVDSKRRNPLQLALRKHVKGAPYYHCVEALIHKGLDPRKLGRKRIDPYTKTDDKLLRAIYFRSGVPMKRPVTTPQLIEFIGLSSIRPTRHPKSLDAASLFETLYAFDGMTVEKALIGVQENLRRARAGLEGLDGTEGKQLRKYVQVSHKTWALHFFARGLWAAAYKMNPEVLFAALEHRVPFDVAALSPELFQGTARIYNYPNILAAAGGTGKYRRLSIISVATLLKDHSKLEALLKIGVDPNIQCDTSPLAAALHTGDVKSLAILVAGGAHVDQLDDTGKSPRMRAEAVSEDQPEFATIMRSASPTKQPVFSQGFLGAEFTDKLAHWNRPGWEIRTAKDRVVYVDTAGQSREVQFITNYEGTFLLNPETMFWSFWTDGQRVLDEVLQEDVSLIPLIFGRKGASWHIRSILNTVVLEGLQEIEALAPRLALVVLRKENRWSFYDEVSNTIDESKAFGSRAELLRYAQTALAESFSDSVATDRADLAAIALARSWVVRSAMDGNPVHADPERDASRLASLANCTGSPFAVGMLVHYLGWFDSAELKKLLAILGWSGTYKDDRFLQIAPDFIFMVENLSNIQATRKEFRKALSRYWPPTYQLPARQLSLAHVRRTFRQARRQLSAEDFYGFLLDIAYPFVRPDGDKNVRVGSNHREVLNYWLSAFFSESEIKAVRVTAKEMMKRFQANVPKSRYAGMTRSLIAIVKTLESKYHKVGSEIRTQLRGVEFPKLCHVLPVSGGVVALYDTSEWPKGLKGFERVVEFRRRQMSQEYVKTEFVSLETYEKF
ncbi:MAG: hypothetical protein ACI9OJ_002127, partial [Myxococcota bacterium]